MKSDRLFAALALLLFAQTSFAEPLTSPLDSSPLTVDQVVEIERRQSQRIPGENAQRLLVVDPAVADARIDEETDTLIVQGLTLGSTYIHIWNDQGRRTIRIVVIPEGHRREGMHRKRPLNVLEMKNWLASNVEETGYPSPRPAVKTQLLAYSMEMQGMTSLGESRTDLRYFQDNTGRRGVSSARTLLRNRAGEFMAGDLDARVSQLTLPYSRYQGAQYESPDKTLLQVQVFGGYNNKQFFGRDTLPGTPEPEQPMAGVKTTLTPFSKFQIFAVRARALNDLFPERRDNRSLGGRLGVGPFAVQTEAALSPEGGAWYGDLEMRPGPAYFVLSRRNVSPDYVAVNGQSWERGRLGHSFQAGMVPRGAVTLFDVRYDQFLERYLNQTGPDPRALNRRWDGKLTLQREGQGVAFEMTDQNEPGLLSPYRLNAQMVRLFQKFEVWEPYAIATRERGFLFGPPTTDYVQTGGGGGFRLFPGRRFGADVSLQDVLARDLNTGRTRSFAAGGARARWENPLTKSLSQRFDFEYDRALFRFSQKRRVLGAQARLDWALGPAADFYIFGRVQDRVDLDQPSRIYSLGSGLQWGNVVSLPGAGARRVEGLVFTDLNGDGIRQKNEPGLAGVRVIMNDNRMARTNRAGEFSFRPQRGELSLHLMTEDLPDVLRLSSSNPQTYPESTEESVIHAFFGAAYTGQILGRVLIDVDGNGLAGAADKPLGKVVFSLDGGVSQATDPEGQFIFSGVSPGKKRVEVNLLTLPPDMVLVTPGGQELEMKQGGRVELVFLIQPVRSVRGAAYWDKNGNGRRDAQEPPVPGVVVTGGGRARTTDGQGRYFLNNFPAGRLTINLDPASARTWRAAGPLVFDVPADRPFVQTSADLPLRKTK